MAQPELKLNTGIKQTMSMEKRLDKIESKIDKLADAMVSIARAEEKLHVMEEKYNHSYDRMNRFSQKLDDIENKVTTNAQTVGVINKLFWVAIIAAAGAYAAQLWM
tara:strand:- start:2299 stop:2616 length:318 start_codon:yes stop_codon:yes gene_type:complete